MFLERCNYQVFLAADAREALELAASNSPQAIILDLTLRESDGFDVLRRLRELSNAPIIVLSDKDLEMEKIATLDLGADDFMVKPFGLGELMARLRAIFRRCNPQLETEIPVFAREGLKIDFGRRLVELNGCELHLTPKEYSLLRYMVMNADRVLTSRQLSVLFGGVSSVDESHTLRVHIANLRKKIETEPENPRFILTEARIGYRFKTGSSAKKATRVRGSQIKNS